MKKPEEEKATNMDQESHEEEQKDYEVRSFIGRDFPRLSPIVDRFNENFTDLQKILEKKGVKVEVDEAGKPKDKQYGEEIMEKCNPAEIMKSWFSMKEITIITKCGLKKPGSDPAKNYSKSLLPIENWKFQKIFKAYKEVMQENMDFFFDSFEVRSAHLTLE